MISALHGSDEIADLFDITPDAPGRGERLALLPRGSARIDASHAVNARIGQMIMLPARAAKSDKFILAAGGWLTSQAGKGPGPRNRKPICKMATRWGLSRNHL